MLKQLALAVAVTATALQAFAQEQEIVIAYDVRSMLASSITPPKRITREQIEQAGAQSFADVLNAVSEFSVYANGGKENLRGFGVEDEHFLILLNGTPLTSVTDGETQIDLIDVNAIEQIEYFSLGEGVIFGSGSGGAVINVITSRQLTTARRTLDVSAGSNHLARARVSFASSDTGSPLHLQGSVSVERTSGFDSRADTDPDDDGLQSAAATLGIQFDHPIIRSINLVHTQSTVEIDGSYTGENTVERTMTQISLAGRFLEGLNGHFQVDFGTTEITALTDDRSGYSVYFSEKGGANISIEPASGLRTGIELREDRYTPGGQAYYEAPSRTGHVAVYLGYERAITEAFFVGTTARIDESEDYGTNRSANLTLKHFGEHGWQSSAVVSQSFRVPTLADAAVTLSTPPYSVIGYNANLKPEILRTVSMNTERSWNGERVAFGIYRTQADDALYYDLNAGGTRNIGANTSYGATLSGKTQLTENTVIQASYAYTRSKLGDSGGSAMAFTPEHKASASIAHDTPYGELTFSGIAQSKMFSDNSETENNRKGGHAIFNAQFATWIEDLRLKVNIENLFNREVLLNSYGAQFNNQPRTATIGVQKDF